MFRPCSALYGLLLPIAACGPSRPPPPVIDLLPATDTLISPVGEVTDAAWLEDGRWVIIAPQDRAVELVDFATRSVARFGGSAARSYSQPFNLFRAGDTIVVADWQLRRATLWSLAGKLIGSVPAVNALRGALPKARDASGRWYFELRPPAGLDGSGNRDSAVVVRTGADFTGADTVARLAPLDVTEVTADGRRRFERRLLSGQDRWGLAEDGALWVARVTQNRVDWIGVDGRLNRGAELPDKVLPVTQQDRDVFLHRFPPELRSTAEQIPFAAIKPPFESAFAGMDGRVWLVKSRAVGDSIRSNQVVDRSGVLAREIRHPGLGRMLGVGGGHALVAEQFEGGVRLLQFALPE
jgi:hypothetical protein